METCEVCLIPLPPKGFVSGGSLIPHSTTAPQGLHNFLLHVAVCVSDLWAHFRFRLPLQMFLIPWATTSYKMGREWVSAEFPTAIPTFPEALGHRATAEWRVHKERGFQAFLFAYRIMPLEGSLLVVTKSVRQEETYFLTNWEFIHHTIQPFKMYNSVVFSVFQYVQPLPLNFRTLLSPQSKT